MWLHLKEFPGMQWFESYENTDVIKALRNNRFFTRNFKKGGIDWNVCVNKDWFIGNLHFNLRARTSLSIVRCSSYNVLYFNKICWAALWHYILLCLPLLLYFSLRFSILLLILMNIKRNEIELNAFTVQRAFQPSKPTASTPQCI